MSPRTKPVAPTKPQRNRVADVFTSLDVLSRSVDELVKLHAMLLGIERCDDESGPIALQSANVASLLNTAPDIVTALSRKIDACVGELRQELS